MGGQVERELGEVGEGIGEVTKINILVCVAKATDI